MALSMSSLVPGVGEIMADDATVADGATAVAGASVEIGVEVGARDDVGAEAAESEGDTVGVCPKALMTSTQEARNPRSDVFIIVL
jgi:hypothetical protein